MLQAITRRLKRGKRGISTVIVVMLSLVLIVIIVSNVVLWSYEMNQLDWEKMQEHIAIVNAASTSESWHNNPSQYNLQGSTSLLSGDLANLVSDDDVYMSFRSYHSRTDTSAFVNNLANVDSSADKGTHSNFLAQQTGPDSTFDNLTEGDHAGLRIEDYVDQVSNVDGSADKGTHSNFNNQKNKDGNYDTLTETNTGQPSTETLRPNGAGDNTQLSRNGAFANWDCVDDSFSDGDSTYVYTTSTSFLSDTYATNDHASGSGTINSVTVYIQARETSSFFGGYARTIIRTYNTNYESSDISLTTSYDTYSTTYVTNPKTDAAWTWAEINAVECGVALRSTTSWYSVRCTQVWIVVDYTPANYELDQEVQFTNVSHGETNEYLCIYAGTLDSENLQVDVRYYSTWIPLISALQPNQWNNVSVSSYLTSDELTIRFKGTIGTGDTTQSSWSIDCSLLHIGTPNYQLDVEVQFTNVDYSRPIEELCIYAGSMGSENLMVDYWSGSSWINLFTNLSSDWNNVTVSLTSTTFTIRFRGASESSDANQDNWNIDAVLLHLGVPSNYELDLEVQWISVPQDLPNVELCIFGGTMSAENLQVDFWNGEAWQNLFTDLTSGWNNVSVSSYLTSSTFTIRFKDSIQTSDSVQNSWNIDVSLLYMWSDDYIAEVEFVGSSNTETWSHLSWIVNSAWTTSSVNVTLQLYNFALNRYPTSGSGYMAYTSDSTPSTEDSKSQTINVNPTDFRDSEGYWKIKIKGVKADATAFDLNVDLIEFHSTTGEEGTRFTFKNEGSLTVHLVALWINNSTQHHRYDVDMFINSGEASSIAYSNVILPSEPYDIKVITERGNTAVSATD